MYYYMILCRKRIQRLNNFAEDKRIINEYEKQRLAEIERYVSYLLSLLHYRISERGDYFYFRRKKENDLRLSRSTEGPAHHVVCYINNIYIYISYHVCFVTSSTLRNIVERVVTHYLTRTHHFLYSLTSSLTSSSLSSSSSLLTS